MHQHRTRLECADKNSTLPVVVQLVLVDTAHLQSLKLILPAEYHSRGNWSTNFTACQLLATKYPAAIPREDCKRNLLIILLAGQNDLFSLDFVVCY